MKKWNSRFPRPARAVGRRPSCRVVYRPGTLAAAVLLGVLVHARQPEPAPLSTGRAITPAGTQTEVGSFPVNMAMSPDGKYLVVTNTGFREQLTVLRVADGSVASTTLFGDSRTKEHPGLYYGLQFGGNFLPMEQSGYTKHRAGRALFVSRGSDQKVACYQLYDDDGSLLPEGKPMDLHDPAKDKKAVFLVSGLALAGKNRYLLTLNNDTTVDTGMQGELAIVDTPMSHNPLYSDRIEPTVRVKVPGFPFAVVTIPERINAHEKAYVSCERDGVVAVVDWARKVVASTIETGDHPTALLLSKDNAKLYVANSGSDTISVIDTVEDRVVQTIMLRPPDVRGLPGCTPLGMALSPDQKRLYVALADMNAVAVVDLAKQQVEGYIPAGWYPTAVAASPDGKRIFVANAKGVQARNPNGKPVRTWGRYIQDILEGTVSMVNLPERPALQAMTRQVLENAHATKQALAAAAKLPKTGIQHVIYIIKENRTYDQVFGDLKQGNGDASLCMFPREVTPNQHALAERFALMDNFYCAAEVSADGWSWSTQGMASEYAARNTPYNYSGRGREYDEEGQNNNVPVDLLGIPDVARSAGGYIWDLVAKKGLSFRNYAFFYSFSGPADRGPDGKPLEIYNNKPNKKALEGHSDEDFLQFDMTYPDSDAWAAYNATWPKQRKTFGAHNAKSRFEEWRREFDVYVRKGELPAFMMVRLPRDHTAGTSVGENTPRAMVADNDYAVGQLVDAVSHSPFWSSTAIFILEDDAQNGFDHVDAHRSPALVISPYVKRGTVDHRFYNTDSMLHTMELLMGLPPMCQYDAAAMPFGFFDTRPTNAEPYAAILPPKAIIAEVNQKTAYRAKDSAKMDFAHADAADEQELNDILWNSTMNTAARNRRKPSIHRAVRAQTRAAEE